MAVLVAFDHALHHLAADGTGLTGGDIAVVALLEVNADGVGSFLLHLVQCFLGFLVRHGLFLSFLIWRLQCVLCTPAGGILEELFSKQKINGIFLR